MKVPSKKITSISEALVIKVSLPEQYDKSK